MLILSLLPLAAGCKKDDNIDDTEQDGLNLTLDIDWRALDKTPSGLTLCLYPTDGSEPLTYSYDAVNQVSVNLKEGDYSLICFNQSEAEFKGYTFKLDSFDEAIVEANDLSSLEPLAVASMKTLAETRGHNRKGAIQPQNIVKGMSISVPAEGVTDRASITGRLSNMATAIQLSNRKPLAKATDQILPPEVWSIDVPAEASKPATLTATFGTLGVFLSDEDFALANGTRAALDDIGTRNILHVTITKEDQTVIEQDYDVTEEVVEQYVAALEAEAHQDISDAFFPMGYESKKVAAWYACENIETESAKRKVLAVYLFDDGSFITTKRKFEANGTETREIEASGQYSLTKGDFSNGEAVIQMDSMEMSVAIVANVMTVYENGRAMEDRFTRQWGSVPQPMALTGAEEGVSADAFFPYGLEDHSVMAWYAWSGKTSSGGEKVLAVYLLSDNLYVTTVRKVENGVETRAIESAGAYILNGDYNNGSATIYVENMEGSNDSIAKTMSAQISNGVMTVFDGKDPMPEQFTRQSGPVPSPSLPSDADDEFAQEAFFPESYASKTVAAWYAWSDFNYEKMGLKVLAVFLFDDNTFVTTKCQFSSEGNYERVIESSGTYSIHTGNYSDGGAYIIAAAGGGDSIMMTADIVNGVMTVYQNGEAMQEQFTRQYSDPPSPSSATNTSEEEKEDEEYTFHAVNLGLSVMWASANVGADTPEDFGYYFAPGETSAKELYSWDNYKYGTSADNLTKYNEKDTLTTLTADDDAATVNLGSQWRTPTVEEWTALKDSCEWIWTLQNDVMGYLVVGQNGNSIFLPAAGMKYDDKWPYEGEQGEYMSSSLVQTYVWATEFTAKDINTYAAGDRRNGLTVRAVRSY